MVEDEGKRSQPMKNQRNKVYITKDTIKKYGVFSRLNYIICNSIKSYWTIKGMDGGIGDGP